MSHLNQVRALTRYCDGLMALVTEIIGAIPQEAANYALVKRARDGLEKLTPLFNEVKAANIEALRTGRGTGRTHRMLIEAVTCAREGRRVLVLAGDAIHVKDFEARLTAITDPVIRERIIIRAYESLERGNVLAGQRFNAVFEDHSVAERRELHWESLKRGLTL